MLQYFNEVDSKLILRYFSRWFRQIVKNKSIDTYKKQQRIKKEIYYLLDKTDGSYNPRYLDRLYRQEEANRQKTI